MKIRDLTGNGELSYYSCLACVAVLPLYVQWLPPIMILWGLAWIYETSKSTGISPFHANKPGTAALLFLILFLWQAAELVMASSFNDGFDVIFKRLSFILFPLVLFYPGLKIKHNITLILRIFAFCTLIYIMYCFGNALYDSISIKDGKWVFNAYDELYTYENFFMGSRLASIVHPTYLAMYVLLTALVSMESFLEETLSFYSRSLWLTASLFCILVIFLLSSRAGVLAAMLILPLYFISRFYRKVSKIIIVLILIAAAAGTLVMFKSNARLKYSLEVISGEGIHETFTKDVRYTIWKSAIMVIRQNLILGVGTGNASKELKKEFKSLGYTDGYYDNLNAHNQFLEILLENGLIGLIIFLSILGYLIFAAISEHNIISVLFILMMVIFFIFESLLNRLAGVTFFPLFAFLLMYRKTKPV